VGGGLVEGAEAIVGIVNKSGEKDGLALEAGGNKRAALVVDAIGGGAGDVGYGGADVNAAVGEDFVRDDVDLGSKGGVRDGGNEDAGNEDADAGVRAGHWRGLRSGSRGLS
jgi:hypothetical protein